MGVWKSCLLGLLRRKAYMDWLHYYHNFCRRQCIREEVGLCPKLKAFGRRGKRIKGSALEKVNLSYHPYMIVRFTNLLTQFLHAPQAKIPKTTSLV